MSAWRLLICGPLDGAANMALDEAILRMRIAGEVPPTIRLYGWEPPTVSLGYGQPIDDRVDLAWCRQAKVRLVRRPTGGSAILHESPDHEVTYAAVGRVGDFPGADDVLESYRVLATGLAAGLARLGVRAEVAPVTRVRPRGMPAFCFARTGSHEIAVEGKKLVGSAQRRQAGAFLQHGSLLLDADPVRVRAAFPGLEDPLRDMTTVRAVLGRRVGFDEAVPALAWGLAEALGRSLERGELSPAEATLAERLVADKYGTELWTWRAEVPESVRAARPGSLG